MNQRTHAGDERRGRVSPIRRAVVAEWGTLYVTVRDQLARRRLAAIPLATIATFLILLFSVVQHLPGGERLVTHLGVVKAALPLDVSLLRTPLSLYVPALDLPVWGALAQVLLVFGIAEIVLGRRMTLLIAYACTLAGTFFARMGVAIGPDHLLGLPEKVAQYRDTGPSAAVVALAVCVAWKCRAWFTMGAVLVTMVGEAVLLPNLAGLEHVVALATAVLIAASAEVFGSYWPRVLTGVGAAALVTGDSRRPSGAVL
ncbi:hypothetical protein P3T37_004116 [Kitasatospora sp. MAA4]|uniref:hypothetical protein n=1 Tax=Kitasatospora sp. MAA4 TaxID=3035093 RepID=UPI002474ED53|nr:hypothetical protein [Kitasatospora sp. MAA4]MDH6134712.1 hypothetical protein [Kitasatospora sp. MAA4]